MHGTPAPPSDRPINNILLLPLEHPNLFSFFLRLFLSRGVSLEDRISFRISQAARMRARNSGVEIERRSSRSAFRLQRVSTVYFNFRRRALVRTSLIGERAEPDKSLQLKYKQNRRFDN